MKVRDVVAGAIGGEGGSAGEDIVRRCHVGIRLRGRVTPSSFALDELAPLADYLNPTRIAPGTVMSRPTLPGVTAPVPIGSLSASTSAVSHQDAQRSSRARAQRSVQALGPRFRPGVEV